MREYGDLSNSDYLRVIYALFRAELSAGIFGLRLFIGCVFIATFMSATVWILGDGLSKSLSRGSTVFLGGDIAITSINQPLEQSTLKNINQLGHVSNIIELRSSAQVNGLRQAVEIKAVDDLYPLYGNVILGSGEIFKNFMQNNEMPSVVLDPVFLSQLNAKIGDQIQIGSQNFTISDSLVLEPDRLSAGRFMVGPRIIMSLKSIQNSGVIQPGSLIEYRYRIKSNALSDQELFEAVTNLEPSSGWEIETPSDAGDRVLETVKRATTFLGMAGVAALLIGLSGAWAAAHAWIRKRTRTIALYRLSGASPTMNMALHALIIGAASLIALFIGLIVSISIAIPLLEFITQRLHVPWVSSDIFEQIFIVLIIMSVGLVGTSIFALSGITKVSPAAAMRNGEAPLKTNQKHAITGFAIITLALFIAASSLPIPLLASLMIIGLLSAISILILFTHSFSKSIAKQTPKGFLSTVIFQSLSDGPQTAARTVALGIGIIGITAIFAAQNALELSFRQELPEKVPDVVIIDVRPDQVGNLRQSILENPDLDGLQADPFMRMTITAVNGVPATEALVNEDKSWVIEGDRSFSWKAEPTGAELLSGSWWAEDYVGPALISPEEDVMEAFDLKVGDQMTYSVLGRSFTSEVVNIRKEYHRTFRPEYLMIASPEPFRNAPHTWIMSLQGSSDQIVDQFIRNVSSTYPNMTVIDVRKIVAQVSSVIEGTLTATLMIALLLIFTGALSLAALVSADVDARKKEALIFKLVGVSQKEITYIRLIEAAASGFIAAFIGGLVGIIGAYFIVTQALNIEWALDMKVILTPFLVGVIASITAGVVGGLGTAPSAPGHMARQLSG